MYTVVEPRVKYIEALLLYCIDSPEYQGMQDCKYVNTTEYEPKLTDEHGRNVRTCGSKLSHDTPQYHRAVYKRRVANSQINGLKTILYT